MDGNVDASRDFFLESHVLMMRFHEVSISKEIRVLQPTPDDAVSMGVDQLTCHVSRAEGIPRSWTRTCLNQC